MAGYMEYKDSGIPWLGEYPAHWECCRVKNSFFSTKTIVGEVADSYERLALTLNGVVKRSKIDAGGLQPERFETYQVLRENELVFKLIDLQNVSTSRIGRSPYTGIVSPAYIILHERNNRSTRYAEYYFLSMWMHQVFNQLGADGVRSNIGAAALLDIPFLLPPESEQESIVTFLDVKINRIDTIIAEAKASIEEYKAWKASIIYEAVTKGLAPNVEMKDSGVEWIGEMPTTWRTMRIKDLGDARNGLTYSPEDQVDEGQGTLVLRSSNVQGGKLAFSDNVYVGSEIPPELILQQGDILICSRNGSRKLIGKNAYIEEDNKYSFGAFMMALRPKIANKKYVYWLLNSGVFGYYLPMFFTSTINQLTRENFRNMVVPYCDDELVQQRIVEYLDAKVSKIDGIIEEKETLVADLEAYKKSLIFEVVTGKRKVV